jgi:hypothetical protein
MIKVQTSYEVCGKDTSNPRATRKDLAGASRKYK